MKTSFYIVLWIIIYPLLGLFNNSFINNNSFFVALIIVWVLSMFINKTMSKTLAYENFVEKTPILEDVYTANVEGVKKRVTQDMWIAIVTSVYFIFASIVIGITIFGAGASEWFTLLIFLFITIGVISRSMKLIAAYFKLKSNPSPTQCIDIAEQVYKLDYTSFYESHAGVAYSDMFPPKPKHFKTFQRVSAVIAVICLCLGLIYVIYGAIIMILHHGETSAELLSVMILLYGSLGIYFGIKDFISSLYTRKSMKISNNKTYYEKEKV